jgi:hypothetical protein
VLPVKLEAGSRGAGRWLLVSTRNQQQGRAPRPPAGSRQAATRSLKQARPNFGLLQGSNKGKLPDPNLYFSAKFTNR